MAPWVEIATVAGGLITAIGGAQGVRALVRRRPRPSRQDAAVALSAGTIRWAERLEETADRATRRAEQADAKADQAEARADQAARNASRIEMQLSQVVSYLDVLWSAIDDPDMTMDRLRIIARHRPRIAQPTGEQQ